MLARIRATRENESGFTLIELLIVIVILGVLAGIVVFSVAGITDRGNLAACKSDVATVRVASEAYYAKTTPGAYASAIGTVGSTDTTTLVGSGLLRSIPAAGSGVSYTAVTGAVTSSFPGCS